MNMKQESINLMSDTLLDRLVDNADDAVKFIDNFYSKYLLKPNF